MRTLDLQLVGQKRHEGLETGDQSGRGGLVALSL